LILPDGDQALAAEPGLSKRKPHPSQWFDREMQGRVNAMVLDKPLRFFFHNQRSRKTKLPNSYENDH
jgi:hypothetical protein